MTALVTGATGFIGSAVARALIGEGTPVRALVRPGADRRNIAGLDIEIVQGDLRDPAARREACRNIDTLFHVAADYRLWVRDPDAMYETNVEAAAAMVRAAADAGARTIVHTSSVATLGLDPHGAPADERTPAAFEDIIGHYKRSKFLGEEAVRTVAREEGAPVVIVNPSTPVGPRDAKPTPTGRLIIEAAMGRMPAFVDTGLNIVHVNDVAAGHLLARDRGAPGERYVLGGEDMTLEELLRRVAAKTGRRPPSIKLPNLLVMPLAVGAEMAARLMPKWEPFVTTDGVRMARKHMYFSSEKAKRDLGYAPRPADEALDDALAWFKAHGYLGAAAQKAPAAAQQGRL